MSNTPMSEARPEWLRCIRPSGPLATCANDGHHDAQERDSWTVLDVDYAHNETGEELTINHIFPSSDFIHSAEIFIDDEGLIHSKCACDVQYDSTEGGFVMIVHNRFLP